MSDAPLCRFCCLPVAPPDDQPQELGLVRHETCARLAVRIIRFVQPWTAYGPARLILFELVNMEADSDFDPGKPATPFGSSEGTK